MVHHPQPLPVRIRWRPLPPGHRVGDPPAVVHLADDLATGRPDVRGAAPGRVGQRVGGDLTDRQDQVGAALGGQPRALGEAVDQRPHGVQPGAVGNELRRGRRRRQLCLGRGAGARLVAAAGPAVAAFDDLRVRPAGALDEGRAEPGGVVGAQDGRRGADRQVDQRFVPHHLGGLGIGAPRPHRFGDDADPLPRMLAGEAAQGQRDPGGVAAKLVHVGHVQPPAGRARRRPHLRSGVARQRHEYRLGAGQPVADEGQDVLEVLARIAVHERQMAHAIAAGRGARGCRRTGLRPRRAGRPSAIIHDGADAPIWRAHAGKPKTSFQHTIGRVLLHWLLTVRGCAWRDSDCRHAATARWWSSRSAVSLTR